MARSPFVYFNQIVKDIIAKNILYSFSFFIFQFLITIISCTKHLDMIKIGLKNISYAASFTVVKSVFIFIKPLS